MADGAAQSGRFFGMFGNMPSSRGGSPLSSPRSSSKSTCREAAKSGCRDTAKTGAPPLPRPPLALHDGPPRTGAASAQ
eukprot:6502569-Prymnesium_polylepis.1